MRRRERIRWWRKLARDYEELTPRITNCPDCVEPTVVFSICTVFFGHEDERQLRHDLALVVPADYTSLEPGLWVGSRWWSQLSRSFMHTCYWENFIHSTAVAQQGHTVRATVCAMIATLLEAGEPWHPYVD